MFLVASIVLYPLIFLWQGGDLTDTGYLAYLYQSFDYRLSIGQFGATAFLTEFFGYNYLKLFGNLISLKFLYLIALYGGLYNVYRLCVLFFSKEYSEVILGGLLVSVSYAVRTEMNLFGYDIASFYFLSLMLFLLAKVFLSDKPNYLMIFYIGSCVALATLFRFPNFLFILVVPCFFVINNLLPHQKNTTPFLKRFIPEFSVFFLGTLSVLLLFYFKLSDIGIWEDFRSSLPFIGDGQPSKNSHRTGVLLGSYIFDLKKAIPHLLIWPVIILVLSILGKNRLSISKILIASTVLIGFSLLVYKGFDYFNPIKYMVPAILTAPICYLVFISPATSRIRLMLCLIILTTFIQVAGTNTGLFLKMTFGLMILMPFVVTALFKEGSWQIKSVSLYWKNTILVAGALIFSLSTIIRVGGIYHVGTGIGLRLGAVHPVHVEKMSGILTTKDNAQHIEHLTADVKAFTNVDDKVLIFGHQPLFYFLTERHPPVPEFWLYNNAITPMQLFDDLDDYIDKTGKWPVIIDTNEKVLKEEGELYLANFLSEYDYERVVENSEYVIWKKTNDSN